LVSKFIEKPDGDGTLINGGFFVLSPKVLDLIEHDNIIWEKEPLQALASAKQLSVFKHKGFWQPMDTLRDKNILENSWSSGKASWKLW
jgi:glucose-1-phosphate cytidylyltransferase